MEDITQVFDSYLAQYGSVDIAEAEFKKICMRTPTSKPPIVNGVMR